MWHTAAAAVVVPLREIGVNKTQNTWIREIVGHIDLNINRILTQTIDKKNMKDSCCAHNIVFCCCCCCSCLKKLDKRLQDSKQGKGRTASVRYLQREVLKGGGKNA